MDTSPAPPSEALDVAGVQWTIRDVIFGMLWFFGLFLLAPLPIAVPVAFAAGEDSETFYAVSLILGACTELALIGVAAWYTWRKYGGSWERLGFRKVRWSVLGWAAVAIIGAFAISAAYGGLIELFDLDWLRSERDDQIPQEVLDSAFLLTLAGIVVIGFAPLCEEIFFRGFIFPGIARWWGVPAGIVLSAALFSVAHIGPNMHKTLIPILGIGLMLAFAYWRSGSILSSIAAHLAFNIISFSVLAAGEN
jgi:membrane protease YdiL (CAAX protease family)